MLRQEEIVEILEKYSKEDLFFGDGTKKNHKRQKEAIELYYWKKKMKSANRMKSKKKRKQYKQYLYGLHRI